MRLVAFDPADAGVVSGWATDPVEVAMWCGHKEVASRPANRPCERDDPRPSGLAPVPPAAIVAWSTDDSVRAYALYGDDGALLAYGELWLDAEEQEVELARLIVNPARRGAGVGRRLVTLLAAQATTHYPDVFLRVHPDNAAALRSYTSAGFVSVPDDLQAEWNAPQPVNYVWLRLPV